MLSILQLNNSWFKTRDVQNCCPVVTHDERLFVRSVLYWVLTLWFTFILYFKISWVFFFLFTCNLNIICPVFASKTNKNKAYQNCKNFKLTQINDAFHSKPKNSLIPSWVLPWKNISLASFFISISFPFGNPFMQARKPNIRLSRVFASRSVVVHTVYCLRWKWQECTRLRFPDIL